MLTKDGYKFSCNGDHVYFFGLMIAIGIISAVFFAEWQA